MKSLIVFMLTAALFTSCVTKGKYETALHEKKQVEKQVDSLETVVRSLKTELAYKQQAMAQMEKKHIELEEKYNELKDNSTEGALQMIEKLEALEADILEREKSLEEVQKKLEARDQVLRDLKSTVQNALLGFEEGDLSVSLKNGKVYVSLSNKLLFASGSTTIDQKGKDALLELSKVLKQNSDINILVEGHTDDQAVRPGERMKDNWDLSVLRATEVVRYMTGNGEVDPKRVIASGRSEYIPVDENDTPEARSKNRRTEIILTPKLEKLYNIIEG